VRDEEQTIPVFVEKIESLSLPAGVDLRVVFVEDSSTDGTRPLLRRLARENSRVSYYSVAPGMGQCPAIVFGLSRSAADAMIMMDVDGSHPVDVVPEMVRGFLDGAQVVQCVRRTLTNRKLYRRLGAIAYQTLLRLLTGADPREQLIYYRLVSAAVARQLVRQPRYWHYLRFPLPRRPDGALRKIEVDTEERTLGESKYGFWRLTNLAMDGIFSQISTRRCCALLATIGSMALLLQSSGRWLLAALAMGCAAALAGRYLCLRRPGALRRMRVVEAGDTPESSQKEE